MSETLGNPAEFKLPTTVAMLHLGIKHKKTYKESLAALVEHGLVFIVKWSQNQYQATTVSLMSTPNNDVSKNDTSKNIGVIKNDTSKNNGVSKNDTSKNNGVLKNDTPKNNDASLKQHILKEKNHIKNIWCDNNCAESVPIIPTNFSTNKDSKSINSNDPLKISPPNLLEKTNEDYKQAALTESGFINTFKGIFKNDDYLPGWLLEFNKWLAFCGKIHKNDAEYRIHFNHWIITVPGYKTAMPGDYSITCFPHWDTQF